MPSEILSNEMGEPRPLLPGMTAGRTKIMRKERRWMTSVIKEAAKSKLEMPWTRGQRRDAFIAKRSEKDARTARA